MLFRSLYKSFAFSRSHEGELEKNQESEIKPLIRDSLRLIVENAHKFAGLGGLSVEDMIAAGNSGVAFAFLGTFLRTERSYVEWSIKNMMRCACIKAEYGEHPPEPQRLTVGKQPKQCPFCGSADVKPIVYGLPSNEFDRSKYISGGCCICEDSPSWGCENCRAIFFNQKEL